MASKFDSLLKRFREKDTDAEKLQGVEMDATVASPSDGKILVYRSAGSDWVLEDKPSSSSIALDDVTDVTVATVADNEVLAYDNGSGEWINQTPAEAGLAEASHGHTASDISDFDVEVSNNTDVSANTSARHVSGSDNQNLYSTITDGSNSATPSSETDTLKFRSANNLLGVVVADNDATHGDNVLLTVNESNIDHDNLTNYVADEHIDWTADQGATNINDANIAESGVTQHEGALSITESQISDLDHDAVKIRGVGIDATVASPSDGKILVYRTAGTDWVLEDKPAGGSNPALNDVTDVTISSVADNEVLAYDTGSSEWINQTPAEAGLAEASHGHTASDVSDFSEAVDDRVGALVAQSDSISWYYDDGGNTLYANVEVDDSTIKVNAGSNYIYANPAGIDHDSLLNFVANEHLDWSADQGATNIHVNNITETAVTQHQAALSITESQISDLDHDADKIKTVDVTITSIGDNDILAYDSGSGDWINQTAAEAGLAVAGHSHTASDVTDFDTEVSNNSDVASNTASRHTAATLGTKTIDEADIGDGKVITYNATSGNLEYETPAGGSGLVKYTADISNASSGSISAATHGAGSTKALIVQLYEDGSPNSQIEADITVADDGTVAWETNTSISGHIVIIG